MSVRDIERRLARVEALGDEAGPIRGVSGVLAACARDRAERRARGITDEEHEAEMAKLPKPAWVVSLRAAMDRYREIRDLNQ